MSGGGGRRAAAADECGGRGALCPPLRCTGAPRAPPGPQAARSYSMQKEGSASGRAAVRVLPVVNVRVPMAAAGLLGCWARRQDGGGGELAARNATSLAASAAELAAQRRQRPLDTLLHSCIPASNACILHTLTRSCYTQCAQLTQTAGAATATAPRPCQWLLTERVKAGQNTSQRYSFCCVLCCSILPKNGQSARRDCTGRALAGRRQFAGLRRRVRPVPLSMLPLTGGFSLQEG